jgi:hypothetical protein
MSKNREPPFPAAAISVGLTGENITEYKLSGCGIAVCSNGSVNVQYPYMCKKKVKQLFYFEQRN